MWFEVFRLVLLFFLSNRAKVFSWELLDANKKLGKEWSQDLEGQNICDDKYNSKERYYICYEATKIMKRKAPLLSRTDLGEECELRLIKCQVRRVYFSYRYRNGTYLSATRPMYQCPVADPNSNMNIYFFGQGRYRNEVGVYREVYKQEGDNEVWFHGIMKDIDLDNFGKQLYRRNVKLMH